jgi:hypothetical protein
MLTEPPDTHKDNVDFSVSVEHLDRPRQVIRRIQIIVIEERECLASAGANAG